MTKKPFPMLFSNQNTQQVIMEEGRVQGKNSVMLVLDSNNAFDIYHKRNSENVWPKLGIFVEY